MSGLYYSHHLDNTLEDASDIDVRAGTVLTDADTDKLYDWEPAAPFRIDEDTLEIVVDHGSATAVAFVALIHSNLTVAARLQRNATDSWAVNSTVDVNFAIPSINRRGLFTGPWLDLSGTPALRYTRLTITSNAHDVVIGEWFLGSTLRSFTHSYQFDPFRKSRRGDTVLHVTHANTDIAYERAVGRKAINGSFLLEDSTEVQQFEDWRDSSRDMARPFVIVPDVAVRDAWVGRFGSDSVEYEPLETADGNNSIQFWRVDMPIVQVGHSLAWIDADAL